MARKPSSKKTPPQTLRTKVLLAVLKDVPFDGWCDELFDRAAKKLKISEDVIQDAFPRGIPQLIETFSAWANDETEKALASAKMADMRVRDKVAFGVRTRLEILAPHKEALSLALKYMALPPRHFLLPAMVWATADMIWRMAGDTATDYNRYTKRILLSGVLSATGLYWLNDTSKNHEKTWAFLDRRIDDVLKAGQMIGKIRSKVSKPA